MDTPSSGEDQAVTLHRCIACGAEVAEPFPEGVVAWTRAASCGGGMDVVCEPCATERGPMPPREIAEADQMAARQADPAEREWLDQLVGRGPGMRKTAQAVADGIAAEVAEHPGFTREMWGELRPVAMGEVAERLRSVGPRKEDEERGSIGDEDGSR